MKLAACYTALVLSVGVLTTRATTCDEEVGSVVIVGAGFAGLTAAHALKVHGCTQVTILESRDRIGGRAYTLGPEYGPIAGIDVGAHWVVAGKSNPITSTLAKLLGVELRHVGGDDDYQTNRGQLLLFDADGSPINRRVVDSSFDLMQSRMKMADLIDSKRFSKGLPDISMADALQKATGALNYSVHDKALMIWHDQIFFDDNAGAPVANISLGSWSRCPDNADAWYHGALPSYEGANGDAIVVGGFVALEEKLAEGVDIKLQTAVTKVEHVKEAKKDVGVRITYKNSTNHTNTIFVNRTIVTVPLGVLKTGVIEFKPAMDSKKMKSIKHMGFGSVGKLILGYEKPFWPQQYYGFGIAEEGWHYIVNHKMEYGPEYGHQAGQHNILDFYQGGKASNDMEAMTLEQAVKHATGILQKLFGNTSKAFKDGQVSGVVPQPIKAYKTDWHTSEWSRGTWSSYTMGSKCSDVTNIAAPMADDRILFAGEGTCSKLQGDTHRWSALPYLPSHGPTPTVMPVVARATLAYAAPLSLPLSHCPALTTTLSLPLSHCHSLTTTLSYRM
jgi:monoamine oxidase